MAHSAAEEAAMLRALELAASPEVPLGAHARVGCVLLDADGNTLAEGFHRGAGTPHAEAAALAALVAAGGRARGATAVVTLEPCNHTGRTGPCAQALIESRVRRVVFAQADPNPVAQGGADSLRAAGIDVASGLLEDQARAVNRIWSFVVEHRRPFVTWKFATTLDGRSAAADGTSRWVSSLPARRDTHRLRRLCDSILVGTNTVEVDDPALTVRDADDELAPLQPLRVVMGKRNLDTSHRVFDDSAATLHLRTRDPRAVLDDLFARDRQHLFLEGGPTVAAAFLQAGLVDEVIAYVAPMLLGAGRSAVGNLGISTIGSARHLRLDDVTVLGTGPEANLRLTLTPSTEGN